MGTVQRNQGFPLLAVALGALGSGCAALGLLGLFAPQAVDFAPMLRESLIASALIGSGAVFMVVELVLLLVWARRRREAAAGS